MKFVWRHLFKFVTGAFFALFLLMTACADEGGVTSEPTGVQQGVAYGDVEAVDVLLPDGTSVTCVIYDGYKSGGITCDWTEENTL